MIKIKLIITFILTSQLIVSQSEQNITSSKVKVGLNAGPNYNSLRGASFAETYNSGINFFVGGHLEVEIAENIAIVFNLNYENISVQAEYDTFSGIIPISFEEVRIKDKMRFQYLNIPVLARFYTGAEKRFFINGGLFYSNLLDASNKMINQANGQDLSDIEYNELFKKDNFGISFGIGFKVIDYLKQDISLELRNDLGIKNISKIDFGGFKPTNTNSLKLILNWSFDTK